MPARDDFLAHWRAVQDGSGADADLLVQPFPGLRSFWQTEADLFFGRERQIADLLRGLATRKVTFVLGGSGSGKSSLVRAGVMPRLITAPVVPRVGAWYAIEFRPGEAPSAQLVEAILTQIIDPALKFSNDADQGQVLQRYTALSEAFNVHLTGSDLDEARRACHHRLRQLLLDGDVIDTHAVIELADKQLGKLDILLSRGAQAAPPNLLILVDQFEEVFESKVRANDRQSLISLIKEVWRSAPDTLYVIVTVRSEELHRCSEFEGLSEVINASFYLVDLVGEADLIDAMVGPARRILKAWGLGYDEPFTPNAIATLQQTYRDSANTASSADRLPLIQHLLTLVWNRAVQRWAEGSASGLLRIDVSDIQAIEGWTDREGPLRGCLTAHANRVLDEAIAEASRVGVSAELADRLFRAAFCTLARRDDRGNPKRNFATLEDMLKISGFAYREAELGRNQRNSRQALLGGLELFQRTSLIGVVPENGMEKFNVSHEAFIRGWRRYGEWLDHARLCETRLIDVDEKLRDAEANPSRSRRFDLMDFVFADRLRWAAMTVTDETARLLEDVLGPNSIFSWEWARDVLVRNDANAARISGTRL